MSLLLVIVLSAASAEPSPRDRPPAGGPHAADAFEHRGSPSVLERRALSDSKGEKAAADFNRVVYGFYPYWVSASEPLPWDHLTHLSFFSAEVNEDGSLGDTHGWTGSGGRALVLAGEAHGVAVTLTATLFDEAAIGALLSSASQSSALVQNLVAVVAAQGGQGVNIDFEMVPRSAKDDFVEFMGLLSSVFHQQIPGSHVTLASPAVDWTGAYDYDALAAVSDGLLIMGYDYHWGGSDPGPVAPVSIGTTWTGRDLRWTVDDYLTHGGVANRDRFVLGVPLYGRDWPSVSSAVPGTKAANGTALLMESCDTSFENGKTWDADSETPYRVYQTDTQWHQLFCEDTASLAAKFDLVTEAAFGGVMFWAVGYVPATHPLWLEVDARFKRAAANQPPVAVVVGPPSAQVGSEVLLDGSLSADPDGDLLTYAWTATEGPAIEIGRADRPIARVVPSEVGTYQFVLVVNDGLSAASADVLLQVEATPDGDPGPSLPPPPDDGCATCSAARGQSVALFALVVGVLRRRWRR